MKIVKIFVTAETTNGYKDTIAIELNIIHDLIHFDFSDSTCIEKENIEYWYCSECNKYFSDSNICSKFLLKILFLKIKIMKNL